MATELELDQFVGRDVDFVCEWLEVLKEILKEIDALRQILSTAT